MKAYRGVIATILAGLMCAALSACEKEGPAEKAGKAIDDAASGVAENANAAKEAVEKKMAE